MSSKPTIPKTPGPFRKWLEQQDPERKFNLDSADGSPVDHWLKDRGFDFELVLVTQAWPTGEAPIEHFPDWLSDFGSALYTSFTGTGRNRPRVRTCLRILDEVTR